MELARSNAVSAALELFLLKKKSRQNDHRCTDDLLKCIFVDENVCISIKISLLFVLKGPIKNIPAWARIMACHRPGDKPLSGTIMFSYWRIYVSLGLNELTSVVLI